MTDPGGIEYGSVDRVEVDSIRDARTASQLGADEWDQIATRVRASLRSQGIDVPVGRPRVGTAVHVRLEDSVLERVDALAAEKRLSRAHTIRALIETSLNLLDKERRH